MNKFLLTLFLFVHFQVKSQVYSEYSPDEQTNIYNIELNEKLIEERAFYISYNFHKNADIVFCFTDYKTATVHVYSSKEEDLSRLKNIITSSGYSVKSISVSPFSNDLFLYMYYQYYSKDSKFISEADMVPPKIRTGNIPRDFSLYISARKFWGNKYPERLLNLVVDNESEALLILPADFPKWKCTGNERQDETLFEKSKTNWIKNNPVLYEKIKHLNWDKLCSKQLNSK